MIWNIIIVEKWKIEHNNKSREYINIFHSRLCTRGLIPKFQRLDNKNPENLKESWQGIPPNMYCRNAAEWASRTFQNHFIAGLCGMDTKFPLATSS